MRKCSLATCRVLSQGTAIAHTIRVLIALDINLYSICAFLIFPALQCIQFRCRLGGHSARLRHPWARPCAAQQRPVKVKSGSRKSEVVSRRSSPQVATSEDPAERVYSQVSPRDTWQILNRSYDESQPANERDSVPARYKAVLLCMLAFVVCNMVRAPAVCFPRQQRALACRHPALVTVPSLGFKGT
jgi:hypothetical protein